MSKPRIICGCALLLAVACSPSDQAVFGPDAPPSAVSGGGNTNITGGSAGAPSIGGAAAGVAGAPHAGGGMAPAGGPPEHPAAGDANPPDPEPAAAGAAGADNAAGGSGQPPGPVCGNGVIEAGEQCDGDGSTEEGCNAECQVVCSHYGTGALQSDDHHCYKGFDEHDFAGGRQDCLERGGHLATIASAAENKLVLELVNVSKFIGGFEDVPLDTEGTGNYAWVTGEAFDYENWAAGEPDQAVTRCATAMSGSPRCYEHCVAMLRDGKWTDERCDRVDGYICEWEPPGSR